MMLYRFREYQFADVEFVDVKDAAGAQGEVLVLTCR